MPIVGSSSSAARRAVSIGRLPRRLTYYAFDIGAREKTLIDCGLRA
jgi:hypothetical protein